MEIRQLRAFVAIAETGTFTAGALRVHVTQAAISMQIRQLESEIGARVFVRAPRHVILTEAGEQLLRRARHILREHDAALDEIAELAKKRRIVLIEDSACALGGKHNDVSYGTFGDIGVWSFDSMKLLVTGDGGMIRISDEEMRTRVYNRVHLGGVRPGAEGAASNSERWWGVKPVCWGRLAFMNDLAAAIGQVQLNRIDEFIDRRKLIAQTYDTAFASTSWLQLPPPQSEGTVPYFYWIQTLPAIRDNLAKYLRERQIYTTFRYWPLHRTELYKNAESYPGADLAADTTLLLPVHQNLSDSDVDRIIEMVNAFRA